MGFEWGLENHQNPWSSFPGGRHDYYDGDAKALEGAGKLANLKSVAQVAKIKGDSSIGNAGGVTSLHTALLSKPASRNQVREGEF